MYKFVQFSTDKLKNYANFRLQFKGARERPTFQTINWYELKIYTLRFIKDNVFRIGWVLFEHMMNTLDSSVYQIDVDQVNPSCNVTHSRISYS